MTKKQGSTRARNQEAKTARRDHILEQSFELFKTHELDSISMESLAKKSGLAKGTLYLYFQTKEEVFLECTRRSFQNWIETLKTELSAGTQRLTAQQFSAAVLATLNHQPELPKFLSLLHSALEKNISDTAAFEFKKGLKDQLIQLAQTIEGKTPALSSFEVSFSFLMKSYSLLVGLYQVCNPQPQIKKVISHPDLALFQLSFEEQFRDGLQLLLLGFEKLENKNTYHFYGNY